MDNEDGSAWVSLAQGGYPPQRTKAPYVSRAGRSLLHYAVELLPLLDRKSEGNSVQRGRKPQELVSQCEQRAAWKSTENSVRKGNLAFAWYM